ncbi:MAG: TonB-dependent receptor [Candidatus Marinimicrobia bacterium]|nr:TonB-dependent receptor [Candidatus Neomarinimicrobiota bacterium]
MHLAFNKNHNILQFLAILVVSSVLFLNAATTGKIAGTISDKETGQPLPGANVVIEGTSMGAASNNDGYYVILNVSPGTYNLKISMIGYKTVVVKEVNVNIDLTTTVEVEMVPEAMGMEEVVVEARRPVVAKDVSASELNVNSEKIESLPINDVEDVINLQAGVEDGLAIRGGSARQTTFIIDGFVQNDERSHDPVMSMNMNTVKEVKVQTGGFNAEYGQSRSGVINVVTKEGPKTSYTGAFTVRYHPPTAKHYGSSAYSEDSYFLRPYMDPEVCYTGTKNGNWDQYTREQYPIFEGWNYVAQSTLRDSDPDNDLSPEGAKRLFEYQHRRQGDIKKSDYVIDAGLGGPVPLVSDALGNLRFYGSYRQLREMFVIPVSRESYNNYVGNLKLTSDITSDIKAILNLRGSRTQSTSPYNWTTTPTGDVMRSTYSVAARATSEMLFVPAYYSPADIDRGQIGLKINHVIASDTYYEFKIQHDVNAYNTFQMDLRDTTDNTDIFPVDGELLVDQQPYGYWGYGVGSVGDNIRLGGWQNLGRDSSVIQTTKIQFDFVNQFNSKNQFKTGIDITLNNYDIQSSTSNPGMETWNREQVYEVSPYRIGVYAQDKLEFQGFIANLGLRLDYTYANREYYTLDPYSEYYESGKGNLIEDEAPSKDAKAYWAVSPRLGISHPITDDSKLYFNYGHFRTEPESSERFRIQRYYDGSITSIGNPNLKMEKTVSYEVGYSHNLFDQFLLNIAGYYKNVTNQIGNDLNDSWIYYENVDGTVKYYRPDNNQYEDIRGFEITLDKKRGDWLTGFFNYTYMVNTYGYFGYMAYYENPNRMREYLMQNPYQEKPSPQPYARFNLDFHTPDDFGPKFSRYRPLGGWNLNLLGTWRAGDKETFNPNNILGTGVINNVQWVDYYNLNARLSKRVKMEDVSFKIFVDISNVFNIKRLSTAGFSGSRDRYNYMNSLHFDWEDGIQHGDDRVGRYRESDVEYIPMQSIENVADISSPDSRVLYYDQVSDQYKMYKNGAWEDRSKDWVQKNVLDKNAYINMPDIGSLTFLNPRYIEFGIQIMF